MRDESIRDRADDHRFSLAEFGIENILKPKYMRFEILETHVAHAVVCGQPQIDVFCGQKAKKGVELLVERERFRGFGRIAMLHKVSEREVHDFRTAVTKELQAGLEHEERKRFGIFAGLGFADIGEHIVNAVFFDRALIRVLGRKGDIAARQIEILLELPAKFVFGSNGDHAGAGIGKPRKNGLCHEELGIGHDNRFPSFRVKVIIAGNTVLRHGNARDDGHVVGAGEGRYGGLGSAGESFPDETRDVWELPAGEVAREIARIRAVDADGNTGAQRTAIVNVIDGKQ